VDFVSTHVYGNDSSEDVFGTHEAIPRTEMVCRAVRKVHDQVQASSRSNLPIIWSEYNASYKNEPDVTDAPFMGPWLADTIRQCDGLVSILAYWAFSDVFEEQGVVKQPFYGGYGLIAERGIPKPAFNAFKVLHLLGDQRIAVDSKSALATKSSSGALVLALWNEFLPEETGQEKQVKVVIKGMPGAHRALITRVDANHGSVLSAYAAMGRPVSPTQAQIEQLRRAAMLAPPETLLVRQGEITVKLPPHGLALVELH
jgi:xylan 1,4-beta-xylosidase